ncbi:restriction endonuclease subunit S [Phaeobacter inhibens]|uniref:restriction endonuclease subunit S n=1 Tax=Phaeobacter inhibens TaxID=221822 RepID=UPI000418E0F1|nr:restriction endonuclease subunit S [Phaeobacter inhibens]
MSLEVINGHKAVINGVPSDWTQSRMRDAVGSYQLEKNEDPEPVVLSLTKQGVRVKTDLSFGKSTDSYIGHQIVEQGQFVFTPRDFDATPILCGLSPTKGCISNLYIVFDVAERMDPRFLEYYFWGLKYGYDYFAKLSHGMRYSFNREQFERIPLVYPEKRQQTAIADYLDRETGRIDGLIAKKTRFIALLKEKRAAVISLAVTKGIDPSAQMKPSGVDWIGDIPQTWRSTKLGYLGRSANGINIGGDAFGKGHPFVSYGDVYKNRQLPETVSGLVESTRADRVSYSIKKGDILFTRTSETIDEIAFPSVCLKTIPDAVFAGFLIRFRPYEGMLDGLFSKYAFQSSSIRHYFGKEMKLVTRASLSQGLLQSLPVPLPPIEEQRRIGAYLERQNDRFEALMQNTQETIELLKERRAALITAAVTGKIDVRAAA